LCRSETSKAVIASFRKFDERQCSEIRSSYSKLSKDEVLAKLRGASVSGLTATGGETQIDWKEDGSVSGFIINATGRRGSIFGTWRLDDAGKVCRDITMRFYESTQIKDCFVVYGLGDQIYFPATASTDPSAGVLKRTVKHLRGADG
jgi:hypothetical protein